MLLLFSNQQTDFHFTSIGWFLNDEKFVLNSF